MFFFLTAILSFDIWPNKFRFIKILFPGNILHEPITRESLIIPGWFGQTDISRFVHSHSDTFGISLFRNND